ncbi:hypothetical protein RFI_33173 [Reticulomyxa filosa]|uniref:Uncharacterized protein n=1 Tax=Reticulomyxa filosa TaxID=46433 RepID=X6LRG2_RETFI|nr:hypothetical protein RFI_33173 [Reticulomyxa filosa]|eukprot:ETO04224.1 hypothetical protein RFI_33173 [Reticulomyxa filosa]
MTNNLREWKKRNKNTWRKVFNNSKKEIIDMNSVIHAFVDSNNNQVANTDNEKFAQHPKPPDYSEETKERYKFMEDEIASVIEMKIETNKRRSNRYILSHKAQDKEEKEKEKVNDTFTLFSSYSTIKQTLKAHTNYVKSIDCSTFRNKQYICSGAQYGTIIVYNMEKTAEVKSKAAINCVKIFLHQVAKTFVFWILNIKDMHIALTFHNLIKNCGQSKIDYMVLFLIGVIPLNTCQNHGRWQTLFQFQELQMH